jgi:hypothetical protein
MLTVSPTNAGVSPAKTAVVLSYTLASTFSHNRSVMHVLTQLRSDSSAVYATSCSYATHLLTSL